jgi:hypothetical protein
MALITELGVDKFKAVMINWLTFIISLKEKVAHAPYYVTYTFITDVNTECLKGFIWLCSHFNDSELLRAVAAVAERAYRKISGVGQTAGLNCVKSKQVLRC